MANILPFETQKKIWGMYRARFLIAASLVSLALSALAALALLPGYLAIQLAAPPVSDAITHNSSNVPNDIAIVSRTQALIGAINPLLSATTSPSALILAALAARPADVAITHITYTTQPSIITFGGSASRSAISAYRDLLAQDTRFQSVSIPVDSLIGTSNSFTISMRGAF